MLHHNLRPGLFCTPPAGPVIGFPCMIKSNITVHPSDGRAGPGRPKANLHNSEPFFSGPWHKSTHTHIRRPPAGTPLAHPRQAGHMVVDSIRPCARAPTHRTALHSDVLLTGPGQPDQRQPVQDPLFTACAINWAGRHGRQPTGRIQFATFWYHLVPSG